jgi:hypothetical protein
MHCYWPNGYSLIKNGYCVACIRGGGACQKHVQCCSRLACHKGSRSHVNGRCDELRMRGMECHDDEQCRSQMCHTTFGEKIKGYGGICT